MNKLLKLGVVVMVLFTAGIFVSAAYAQGPGSGPMGNGLGLGLGGPDHSLVSIAAKTLGMERTELVAALTGGKTIADVAKDKGITLDNIVAAFVADRAEMFKSAVAAGRITQAQADSQLEQAKINVATRLTQPFTPRGGGMGMGGNGMRGAGMGQGFVDKDGDGKCDNCGTQQGQGMQGRGRRGGR